jgi:myosin heavy subunit
LRDALAKALYTRLFDWTVAAINSAVSPAEGALRAAGERIIGVLDIFGFEDQLSNGFEQLFINTTNESLQAVFNAQIFKAEAVEYTREEISWDPTVFPDNSSTIDLLEKRPLGLLSMLDSECRRGASALDGEALARSFNKNHGAENGAFAVCGLASVWKRRDGTRTEECDFLVHHFAGDVVYTVQDFIPKNRDALFAHVQVGRTCRRGAHV